MTKPTFASVTEEPCTCHYLQQAAQDRYAPILFDPELNEYNFDCKEANEALRIYHCPFCGGAAPKSKRELLFATISSEEQRRLCELLGRIKTLADAFRLLGPPDRDDASRSWRKRLASFVPRRLGVTMTQPEEGKTPTMRSSRTLKYSHLSETADVHILDSCEDGVHFILQGKYIGPTVTKHG